MELSDYFRFDPDRVLFINSNADRGGMLAWIPGRR
jgi:hypothetical protein